MNGQTLEFYARICACMARIEAMKAANACRADRGAAPAYDEGKFYEEAEAIEALGNQIHEAWQAGHLQ